MREQMSW